MLTENKNSYRATFLVVIKRSKQSAFHDELFKWKDCKAIPASELHSESSDPVMQVTADLAMLVQSVLDNIDANPNEQSINMGGAPDILAHLESGDTDWVEELYNQLDDQTVGMLISITFRLDGRIECLHTFQIQGK